MERDPGEHQTFKVRLLHQRLRQHCDFGRLIDDFKDPLRRTQRLLHGGHQARKRRERHDQIVHQLNEGDHRTYLQPPLRHEPTRNDQGQNEGRIAQQRR
ncbi:hypothetical protein D3C80_1274310 [compost metagenome]